MNDIFREVGNSLTVVPVGQHWTRQRATLFLWLWWNKSERRIRVASREEGEQSSLQLGHWNSSWQEHPTPRSGSPTCNLLLFTFRPYLHLQTADWLVKDQESRQFDSKGQVNSNKTGRTVQWKCDLRVISSLYSPSLMSGIQKYVRTLILSKRYSQNSNFPKIYTYIERPIFLHL